MPIPLPKEIPFLDPLLYFRLFDTPEGEKVLEDLMANFYNTEAYCKGDSHETAYLNGHRFVVGYILNKIQGAQAFDPGKLPEPASEPLEPIYTEEELQPNFTMEMEN